MADSQCVLVFGKSGQVARELNRLRPLNLSLAFAGRDACDLLTDDPGLLIRGTKPSAVINASAYTAVDKAESDRDAAWRLNHDVVASMAQGCAALDIPFVHISTDYVFDGTKPDPYFETDPVNPVSVYGASKAAGEAAVESAGGRWTIFRTAWVFSPFGVNFLKTMRRFAAERAEISVVADQYGRPTLAADIATASLRAAGGDLAERGLFHLAGADDATWADVAEEVFQDHGRRVGVRPILKRITTADYPTPARRPANSRLDTSKLQSIGWSPRPWREAVHICLLEL